MHWFAFHLITIAWYIYIYTVYPKKYAHGFCFAVLCCGYTLTDFPISIRLTSLALRQSNDCPSASKATLMNMDKYSMWIHYERLHNHNKAKHNKTVCIFLGIYCIYIYITHIHQGYITGTGIMTNVDEIYIDMHSVSALLALCAWIHWSLVDSHHKKPYNAKLSDFFVVSITYDQVFLTYTLIADDMRRFNAQMTSLLWIINEYSGVRVDPSSDVKL